MLVGLHGHTHRRFTELSAEEIATSSPTRRRRCATGCQPRPAAVPPAVPRREHRRVRAAERSPRPVGGTSTATRSRTTGRTSCATTRSEVAATRSRTSSGDERPAPTARSCSSTAGRTRHPKRSRHRRRPCARMRQSRRRSVRRDTHLCRARRLRYAPRGLRLSVRLTPDEAWDVLERAHTGILTTLRRDGMPITLPMWFVVLDRTICISAPSGTKKVARLQPRPACVVPRGVGGAVGGARSRPSHRSDRGGDRRRRDRGRIGRAIDAKYAAFRTAGAEMPAGDARRTTPVAPYLRLVPDERILSWDNRKLGLADEQSTSASTTPTGSARSPSTGPR